jgi:hypothetical protein
LAESHKKLAFNYNTTVFIIPNIVLLARLELSNNDLLAYAKLVPSFIFGFKTKPT